jgi:hypothetical protein
LLSDLGVDIWALPALERELAADRLVADELSARSEEAFRQIAFKEWLTRELVAGRRGLIETAARFRALDAGRPGYATAIHSYYPHMADDERYCRIVIGYVEAEVARDGGGQAAVRRLYDELQDRKARGTLVVPWPAFDAAPPLAAVTHGGWGP